MMNRIFNILLIAFCLSTFCKDERPIKVIIPAYNNAHYVQATLDSVFQQNYSNYHVIYIDDCSTDESVAVVSSYLRTHNVENKVTLLKNNKRHRKLKNIYTALHWYCDDDDIIVMLDCDDKLVGKGVFKLIHNLYDNPDIWLTYGQDKPFPEDVARRWGLPLKGNCCATPNHIISNNTFRQYDFVYMHLRTFRAWLFKAIRLQDLMAIDVPNFRGQFYPACNDYAMYYPMLEMAGRHIYFNPTHVYLYNCGSPLNGFKIDRTLQTLSAKEIRSKRKKYSPLEHPIKTTHLDVSHDLHILLLSTSYEQTREWITRSLEIPHADILIIVAQSTTEAQALEQLGFNTVCIDDITQDFSRFSYRFLGIAQDTIPASKHLDLNTILSYMERTKAHAFQWGIAKTDLSCQEIFDDLFAAQIAINGQAVDSHKYAGFYNAGDIQALASSQTSYRMMLEAWKKQPVDRLQVIIYNPEY